MKKTIIFPLLLVICISCAQIQGLQDEPEQYDSDKQRVMTEKAQDRNLNLPTGSSLMDGKSGFTLSGALGLDPGDLNIKSITFEVALDKIGFMPLLSVDAMSGVIVTDWYSLDNGMSRIKINIRVVDQEMSNESVVVSLFTQTLDNGQWIDQGINSEQSLKIKESILSSARALKIASEL